VADMLVVAAQVRQPNDHYRPCEDQRHVDPRALQRLT
jgi:hypothetical protein